MITEYVAKPNLNNNIGLKTFSLESDAIKYLEEYTGYEMSFEKNKKTGGSQKRRRITDTNL